MDEMKEKLYEIPLNDAMDAGDECPFCFIERKMEQDMMDFVLGACASYMESDMREATDLAGFCRIHQKKMFDYGNTLGNGWILKTYYKKLIQELKAEQKVFTPGKTSLKNRLIGKSGKRDGSNPLNLWVKEKESTCYICDRFGQDYERYIHTFFYLYQKDEAFRTKLYGGKGFCLHHFGDICGGADHHLSDTERNEFFPLFLDLMVRNIERMSADVDWLIEKFDYKNKDEDWKQSKDAVQRGMQKIRGGYPGDAVYRMK